MPLFFASGGQGGAFCKKRPPGPVKHPQKLLIKAVMVCNLKEPQCKP